MFSNNSLEMEIHGINLITSFTEFFQKIDESSWLSSGEQVDFIKKLVA